MTQGLRERQPGSLSVYFNQRGGAKDTLLGCWEMRLKLLRSGERGEEGEKLEMKSTMG
jgi:hypothetical protein